MKRREFMELLGAIPIVGPALAEAMKEGRPSLNRIRYDAANNSTDTGEDEIFGEMYQSGFDWEAWEAHKRRQRNRGRRQL